jgi:hypothetical protein
VGLQLLILVPRVQNRVTRAPGVHLLLWLLLLLLLQLLLL